MNIHQHPAEAVGRVSLGEEGRIISEGNGSTAGSRSLVSKGLCVRCCAPLCLEPPLQMLPNVVYLLNSSTSLKNECDVRLKAIAARCSEIEMTKKNILLPEAAVSAKAHDKCTGTETRLHILARQMLLEMVQYSIRKSSSATQKSSQHKEKLLLPI